MLSKYGDCLIKQSWIGFLTSRDIHQANVNDESSSRRVLVAGPGGSSGWMHILHQQQPLYFLTNSCLFNRTSSSMWTRFWVASSESPIPKNSCPEALPVWHSWAAGFTQCLHLVWIWTFLCKDTFINMSANKVLTICKMQFRKTRTRAIKVIVFLLCAPLF